MLFMNQWDIENAVDRFGARSDVPNLATAVQTLDRLADWTNAHSDGWAYWPKPCRAAKVLQELIGRKEKDFRDDGCVFRDGELVRFTDLTDEELRKALTPIKAFLTRHKVDHAEVLV